MSKDKFTVYLAEAILSIKNDTDLVTRCRKVGEEISKENGIEKAVNLINKIFLLYSIWYPVSSASIKSLPTCIMQIN
jgi:hypothetical protein